MVKATPAQTSTMKPRVLVVFGTQTGGSERIAKKMAETWKSKGAVQTVDVFAGNDLAHETEDLASIKESYDVIAVATSSFGEGDPPENFNEFLLKLMLAAEEGLKPLAGMHFAVLGEGSSVYTETFQNCPRLTDKYLEQCGARRCLARHETDVGGEEDEAVSRNLFRDSMCSLLVKGLPAATAKPAAEWSKPRASHQEPTDQIMVKTASELGGGAKGQSLGQVLVPLLVIGVAASYAYWSGIFD